MVPKRLHVHTARFSALVLLGLCVSLSACAVPRVWHYPPEPPGTLLQMTSSKQVPGRVAVLPLRDERGQTVSKCSWVAAIPFIPYGVSTYDRPESEKDPWNNPLIKMRPANDIARAFADELQHAGVFSAVTFAEKSDPGSADLLLSGALKATGWRRAITTYMLGPVGPIFWILGAPIGTATNTVVMEWRLTPAKDPSRTVWRFSMEFEDAHLIGIYYGMEESVENYAHAVQEALKLALADLAKLAAEHPEALSPAK